MHHVGANDTGKMVSTWETKRMLLSRSPTDQEFHECCLSGGAVFSCWEADRALAL